MKKLLLFMCLVQYGWLNINAQSNQMPRKCGSHDDYVQMMQNNPQFKSNQQEIEKYTADYISRLSGFRTSSTLVTIPVVVHVLYNTAAQNISDEQIKTQIDVLNEDFSNINFDRNRIRPVYRGIAGNMDIKFVLARQDPSGNYTNGITRTSTTKTFFCTSPTNDAKFASTGGHDIWNRDKYLNLWVVPAISPSSVCSSSNLGILGYAQFPGGAANTDGVVIGYEYFGRPSTGGVYNLGRTATHEVGHWLNLRHIWGDDSNGDGTCTTSECSGSDQVTDTQNACEENYGNVSCYTKNCSTTSNNGEMFYNYMDYTNDAYMYGFTPGQASRSAALFSSGSSGRGALLTSTGATNVASSPANDAGITAVISPAPTLIDNLTTTFTCEVELTNFGTANLTSCDINYKVNSTAVTTYNWTGTLAPGSSVNVILPVQITVAAGTQYFYAYTSNPNGTTDGTVVNDRIQKRFNQHSATQSLPYTQNFDATAFLNAASLWSNKNYDCGTGAWAKSTATYAGAGSASFANFTQTSTTGRDDEMVTPYLNLSSQSTPKVGFWVAYAPKTTSASDTLELLITTDGGYNYTSIYKKWGAALQTVAATASAFTPSSVADWRFEIVDLTPYQSAKNAQIAFRNITNNQNNLYIDEVVVDQLLNVQNVEGVKSFSVFPNPNNGQFIVQAGFEKNVNAHIIITNMIGQVVYNEKLEQVLQLAKSIDLKNLNPGMYNVALTTEKGTLNQRIVVK